jgi:hypothetical protein
MYMQAADEQHETEIQQKNEEMQQKNAQLEQIQVLNPSICPTPGPFTHGQ